MTGKVTDRDAERHPAVPYHATLQRRKEIPAECRLDRGSVESTNLTVSKYEFDDLTVSKYDGIIVFDPHIPGACVMALDEEGAAKLRDILTAWLQ